MKFELDGVKVLAVDLIGTLARRVGMTFPRRASEWLAKRGCDIAPARFRSLYRKRYFEYTMGNYANDREFYSVLSADLSYEVRQPWLEDLTDVWLDCSPAFNDAQPFLEQASRAYKLVLSSNYVGDWARRLLANNHWEKYFQALVVSSDCRFRKPSREFFLELLKASGVMSPREVLVIGDSFVNDLYGASSIGLQAILVDRQKDPTKRAFLDSATCVQSLDELMQRLSSRQLVSGRVGP